MMRWQGPFSLQNNNDTRTYEYPWAYFATPLSRGMSALEVGGGLSGFQFVLASEQINVTNVDPGLESKGRGFECSPASMEKLNAAFGTSVTLVSGALPHDSVPPESFDRVFCISAIEHFAEEEIGPTMDAVARCLRPGGLFILTADLFLDLHPFTSEKTNEWGRNYRVGELLYHPGFNVVQGRDNELFGGKHFNAERIRRNLSGYFVGRKCSVLIQCMVLEKADHA